MSAALWLSGVRIALRVLGAHKLRSALTMLGIVIGVAAVIAMIAVGSGAEAKINEQIRSLGSNLILLIPGSAVAGGVQQGPRTRYSLTEDDAAAIEKEIPSVQVAAPALHGTGHVVASGSNWSTLFYGVTPEYLEARDWSIVRGRGFEAAEVSAAGKVVLLGETVAKELFGAADPLGATVRVGNVPMAVVGVLERRGQSLTGQDQDDIVLMPLSTARNRVLGAHAGKRRSVQTMMIKVREGAAMPEAEQDIRRLLRQRHRLQPGRADDFVLRNLSQVAGAERESTRVMTLLLGSIAAVSLLVGGIGIMNIMLVSVRERTREIGLRRAVGARRSHILVQFLIEALTLALAGGLGGVLLGLAGAFAIALFFAWPVKIGVQAILLAFAFAAAAGVFFGFYPAQQASRLRPMEAMRQE